MKFFIGRVAREIRSVADLVISRVKNLLLEGSGDLLKLVWIRICREFLQALHSENLNSQT